MAEFDEGISMEDAGVVGDTVSDSASDASVEVGDEGVATATADENPFGWVEEVGMTPEQIRDSVTNYTKKTQELARERESLQPYQQLMEELQADVNLQNIIRDYYQNGRTPEAALNNLESELRTMQTQLALDEEFKQLEKFVAEKNLPDFSRDKVLEFAVDNNIGTMEAAYKAMSFESAQEAARAALEADIKKGRSAALPKSGHGDSAGNTRPTARDISKMSEEDFLENYGGIVKGIVGA